MPRTAYAQPSPLKNGKRSASDAHISVFGSPAKNRRVSQVWGEPATLQSAAPSRSIYWARSGDSPEQFGIASERALNIDDLAHNYLLISLGLSAAVAALHVAAYSYLVWVTTATVRI